MNIDRHTEEFTTVPHDDNLVLTAMHFTQSDQWAINAGEKPSVPVEQVDLCRNGTLSHGTIQLLTGGRVLSMLTLEEGEYDRLEAWLLDHSEEGMVRIFDDSVEQIETYLDENDTDLDRKSVMEWAEGRDDVEVNLL